MWTRSLITLVALLGTASAFELTELYKNKTSAVFWYGGYSTSSQGHCGMGPPTQEGVPEDYLKINTTVGVSSDLYAYNPCGMCVRVKYTIDNVTSTVDAFVNDECVSCGFNELNLGLQGKGSVPAVWQAIPCNVGKNPIEYFFANGSAEYYLKVQPRTYRCPLKAFKALVGENWVDGVRTPDNFFEFDKLGTSIQFPLQVQLVSIFDEQVDDEIPALTVLSSAVGSKAAQFAGCKKPKKPKPDAAAAAPQPAPAAPKPEAVPAPPAPAPDAEPAAAPAPGNLRREGF